MRALRAVCACALLASAAVILPVVSVGATPHAVRPTVDRVPMPSPHATAGHPMAGSSSRGGSAEPSDVPMTESVLSRPTDGADVVGIRFPDRASTEGVTVAVRSRAVGEWGPWTEVGLNAAAPDRGTAEWENQQVATEPVGVTDSSDVEVRVRSARAGRLDRLTAVFVDGGTSPADSSVGRTPAASALAAVTQPAIITRSEWGADESLRTCGPNYSTSIKGSIVHHTVNSNTYSSADVPALLRGIYAYHTTSNGWCDIGYNFLVDRFGRLFEGRYGGVARNVVGAQAAGFNSQTFGVASLGNHDPGSSGAVAPTPVELTAIAKLVGWKASLNGWNPGTTTTYISAGNSKYAAGTRVTLPRVSGHRDVNLTTCPGGLMYQQLVSIRSSASSVYTAGLTTSTTARATPVVETYGRPAGTSFSLSGRGYGHGRGMSQYGAYGAALSGLSRDQILSFYYPGTTRAATMGNPTLRVRLTALGSGGTQVVYQSGLTVSDGTRTISLREVNTDGSARSRWRVVPGGTGLSLQYRESGVWRTRSGWSALTVPLSFANSALGTVRVVVPGGTQRDYRRTLRTVRYGTGAMSVNVLPMDHYLRSVVPSEMTSSWSTAALQAQAVAARTFAAYQKAHVASGSLYDTCDSTACQVYKGRRGYSSTGTVSTYETTATTNAVVATSALAVYYGGGLALTQFSASNGGRTVASSLAYQVSKTDPYDAVPSGSPSRWNTTIPVTRIESTYPSTGRLKALRITKRDGISTWGGRISSVTIIGASGSTTVTGDAFRTAMGLRSVWWTVTSAPAVSAAAFPKDLDGNTLADVLAVDPSGRLQLLSGNGNEDFTPKVIGSGWGAVGLVSNAGAWDGDNRHDVLARSSGTLYYYPSNGKGGFFPPVAIGSGWSGTDLVTGAGDFDGNGHTDFLARTSSTGELRLYRGNGKGGAAGSVVIGPGWNAFRLIAAAGDLTGDGRPDIVAVRASDGTMLVYPGTRTGWPSAPVTVAGSWSGYTAVTSPGDVTGDGRDDLVARRGSDGALVVFAGDDRGHLTQSSVVSGTATWASWSRWTP